MRPITVTVGPLVTATATKAALAQRGTRANNALAINGAASDASASTIASSHSPAAAAFTITNPNAANKYIYITNAGDSHLVTVTVVGIDTNGTNVTEVMGLTNASVVGSVNRYMTVTSITPSGAVTGAVTVGTFTGATLDTPRRLLLTTTADETSLTNIATIYGTDGAGNFITETAILPNNNTVASVLDYLTVYKVTYSQIPAGNISLGTNGVAASPWVYLDPWAMPQIGIQCTISGTVNYSVQQTYDNPNSVTNPVDRASAAWSDIPDTNAVGAVQSVQTGLTYLPVYVRVLLNSGTGSVTMTVSQPLSVTL